MYSTNEGFIALVEAMENLIEQVIYDSEQGATCFLSRNVTPNMLGFAFEQAIMNVRKKYPLVYSGIKNHE